MPDFWSLVDKEKGPIHPTFGRCWVWLGHSWDGRYGLFGGMTAHRYSWKLHCGDFDKKLKVCHQCDNPKCVNPCHLFLGTHKMNMIDAGSKGRVGKLKGEDHPCSVLTEEHAKKILKEYGPATVYGGKGRRPSSNIVELSKKYKVGVSVIHALLKGRTWKHLTRGN